MVGEDNVLLEVKDLKTYFYIMDGVVRAVDGASFSIERQKTLGVVGESGCGKSVTGLTIMGLVPMPPGKIEGGEVLYRRRDTGEVLDLTKLPPKGSVMRSIRGNEIAMIFQEPMTSLNPVYTIGNQITEAVMLHQKVGPKLAKERAIEMLAKVGIPEPRQRVDEYPHQLSGGMRQRAMIAMALSCNPSLLIADEPTTALDVTIQAQILELMDALQREFRMSIMMITHDLAVIADTADDVVVMYMGKIVESADVRRIFYDAKHPYTRGLLKSIPSMGSRVKERLIPIKGVVPDPFSIPKGCSFTPRCPERMEVCSQDPPWVEVDPGHWALCWLYG